MRGRENERNTNSAIHHKSRPWTSSQVSLESLPSLSRLELPLEACNRLVGQKTSVVEINDRHVELWDPSSFVVSSRSPQARHDPVVSYLASINEIPLFVALARRLALPLGCVPVWWERGQISIVINAHEFRCLSKWLSSRDNTSKSPFLSTTGELLAWLNSVASLSSLC